MKKKDIRKRIALNLGILAEDGNTIISKKITANNIDDKIDQIYREELFPLLSDKYPSDFHQHTIPQSSYTATGIASSSSTSTTLVATTGIFNNTMVGFYIENPTEGERIKIITYVNSTTVTLESAIDDTWDGDTFYVLGNEFVPAGDANDFKEIVAVRVKYSATDTEYSVCKHMELRESYRYSNTAFQKVDPVFYETTILDNGIMQRAIGILPYFDSYQGSYIIDYIGRPPVLGEEDEPLHNVIGSSQVIIDGVTAWGYGVLKEWENAEKYEAKYIGDPRIPSGKFGLIYNYKPKTRSGGRRLRESNYITALKNRTI